MLAEFKGFCTAALPKKDKLQMYFNFVLGGEAEIVVLSKIGVVVDLNSLVDGSNPL